MQYSYISVLRYSLLKSLFTVLKVSVVCVKEVSVLQRAQLHSNNQTLAKPEGCPYLRGVCKGGVDFIPRFINFFSNLLEKKNQRKAIHEQSLNEKNLGNIDRTFLMNKFFSKMKQMQLSTYSLFSYCPQNILFTPQNFA